MQGARSAVGCVRGYGGASGEGSESMGRAGQAACPPWLRKSKRHVVGRVTYATKAPDDQAGGKKGQAAATPSTSSNASPSPPKDEAPPSPPPLAEEPAEKPSFSTSASQRYAEEDHKPLAFLSTPLGVAKPPSSRKLTWSERRALASDHERIMEQRKVMCVAGQGGGAAREEDEELMASPCHALQSEGSDARILS